MDYGSKYTDKQILACEKELRKVYGQAQREIQANMDAFNARYLELDKKYRGMVKNGSMTQSDYKEWQKNKVFKGELWQAKKNQVADTLTKSNQKAAQIVNARRAGVFTANANFVCYTIERKAGASLGFGLYNAPAVGRILRNSPRLIKYEQIRKGKDLMWNRKLINNAVLQGIIQGKPLPEIAKHLAKRTASINMRHMTTVARTAMTSAQNGGRQYAMEQAEEMGIELQKQWLATLDEHTRLTHQELDGQVVDVDAPFEVDGEEIMFPADPDAEPHLTYNCRCTMITVIKGFPRELKRRDNTGDKNVVGNMSYKQWEKWKHG